MIKPLSCFRGWGLADFPTNRVWEQTTVYFDLPALKLGEVLSGAVGLPLSVCLIGIFVCVQWSTEISLTFHITLLTSEVNQ